MIAGRFLATARTMNATAREISASNLHRRLALAGPRRALRTRTNARRSLWATRCLVRIPAGTSWRTPRTNYGTPLAGQRTLLQVRSPTPTPRPRACGRRARGPAAWRATRTTHPIHSLLGNQQRGVEQWTPFDLGELPRTYSSAARTKRSAGDPHQRSRRRRASTRRPHTGGSLVSKPGRNALRHNVSGGNVKVATVAAPGRATLSVHNTGSAHLVRRGRALFQPLQQMGPRAREPYEWAWSRLSIVQGNCPSARSHHPLRYPERR